MHPANDIELVYVVQRNSPGSPESQAAIGALFDRHHARIFRYLWFRLNDRQMAEDLTGDVFTRMVAFLPEYKDKELPFQAWLYRIAHNLLIDQYRKQRVPTVQLDEVAEYLMEPVDTKNFLEDQLEISEVRKALDRIDPLQREVVVLRFLIGLPLKEVASILNKSVPAIKAMQFRGLLNLRQILESA